MWMPDMRSKTGLLVGWAIAVAAVVPSPVLAVDKYAAGRCLVSMPDSGAEIGPAIDGDIYLYRYHKREYRHKSFSFDDDDATTVTIVTPPSHGEVSRVDTPISKLWYHYMPNAGYVGQDHFVIQVEKNGVKVRIQYLIEGVAEDEPTTYIGDDGERHGQYCNPESWKISLGAGFDSNLQALLAQSLASGLKVTTADLGSAMVGQTIGTGADVRIALDTNVEG